MLKKHNVQEQLHFNEHPQFQNGRAEELVDSIGRKNRGMLLQLQMPPEFWGAAFVPATDIYNCTPHRSIGMESLHYHRYHKQPDLSFVRAFGYATVVHLGRISSKVYGAELRNTVFVNGPPAPYGTLALSWRDVGRKTVKQVDNSSLAEYLIGSESKIVLPENYWTKHKVSWTTQCMDHCENKRAKGNHTFKCVLLESKPKYVGATGGSSTYEAELSAWHVCNALEQQHQA